MRRINCAVVEAVVYEVLGVFVVYVDTNFILECEGFE
jgi:hypothetical protein